MRRTLAQRRKKTDVHVSSSASSNFADRDGDSGETNDSGVHSGGCRDAQDARSDSGRTTLALVVDACRTLNDSGQSICSLPLEQLREELETAASFSVLYFAKYHSLYVCPTGPGRR